MRTYSEKHSGKTCGSALLGVAFLFFVGVVSVAVCSIVCLGYVFGKEI